MTSPIVLTPKRFVIKRSSHLAESGNHSSWARVLEERTVQQKCHKSVIHLFDEQSALNRLDPKIAWWANYTT